ncbi:Imm26 family immunity protein [Prosthecobacter sp.]|uniref:Imm26 family immunity protein n=1 Tax=Prosthecobacter sp. TaxID=1965333 RepID=UPI0037842A5C
MKKQKSSYYEGSLFLVPLRDHGFVRGLVCRADGKGVVFGHFFGPRIDTTVAPLLDEDLCPSNILLSGCFGELGLTKGDWPVVGELSGFDRQHWPLPLFVREVAGQIYARELSDSLEILSDRRVSLEELPVSTCRDSVMGYGFVEIRLTKLLAEPPTSK